MIVGNMPFGRTSIARPCVINEKFFCECGASHSRGAVLGGAASAYRCLACGITSHVNADSIFLAAMPGDSTTPAPAPSPLTVEGDQCGSPKGWGEGDSSAAPLATDGGGAGMESPDDARQQDAAAAVRDSLPTSDDEAASLIKRAISDAMNARFLIAGGTRPRELASLWRLADNLSTVARELKNTVFEKSDPRPYAPRVRGRV